MNMMEFNSEFYDKLIATLLSTRPEAKDELLKLHGEILALYKANGWTEYPGKESGVSSPPTSSGPSETPHERVKRIEKPVAPVRKDAAGSATSTRRPSVIHAVKGSTHSPRPSPANSPKPADLTSSSGSSSEVQEKEFKRSSSFQDRGIFEKFDQKISEASDPGSCAPKKKLRRVVLADSSSENEEEKANGTEKQEIPRRTHLDIAAKSLEREKKSHSPSPFWNDAVCCVCKISSQDKDNSVVPCTDCNRNYHQNCHHPILTTAEINDPRFIFRCSCCTKKRENKISSGLNTSTLSKSKDTKESVRRKESDESGQSKRNDKRRQESNIQEGGGTHSGGQSSSKNISSVGLASMAADFYAKRKGLASGKGQKLSEGANVSTSCSSSAQKLSSGVGLGRWVQQNQSSGAGGTGVGLGKLAKGHDIVSGGTKTILHGSTFMAQADKRLQAMKKKAAQAKQLGKF